MDQNIINAVVVMKREDGLSILDAKEGIRATSAEEYDVSPARADEIRRRLETIGFEVTSGNLNTISISGSENIFAESFGLIANPPGDAAENHSTKIPDELSDMIADVFVPSSPTFFP